MQRCVRLDVVEHVADATCERGAGTDRSSPSLSLSSELVIGSSANVAADAVCEEVIEGEAAEASMPVGHRREHCFRRSGSVAEELRERSRTRLHGSGVEDVERVLQPFGNC